METLLYRPDKTVKEFLLCNSFVIAIIGPIGSGKSVGCCIKLLQLAYSQAPDRTNVRRTRWAIIRNTYRELLDTTMATFFTWIDKESGTYSALNMTFTIEQHLEDNTIVHAEFLFRALDKPDDIKKLLSLELTGAWVNEARELPKAVIDMLQGRVGRYPSRYLHALPSWFGLILDTNPPPTDHWWYELFEEIKPDNHILFHQPSGLSKDAENINNLPPDYYKNMCAGKKVDWINIYVHGQYGFVADGKPIYPEYNDAIHYDSNLTPTNCKALMYANNTSTKVTGYVGIDFGLTPAAVIAIPTPTGQIQCIDELTTFNMGAVSFGKLLHSLLSQPLYKNVNWEIYGDPAGDQRAQTDEMTPFLILQEQGVYASPTYTNDYTVRRECTAALLTALNFEGLPCLVLSQGTPMLRRALAGGYKYRRLKVSGDDKFHDKPDKNQYSHVAEALQYLVLGAVGDSHIMGSKHNKRLDYSDSLKRVR